MGVRDTMLHELRHVFTDAIGLLLVTGGDVTTYRKALVLLDARADGSGEATTYIPGRENDPEIKQANAIGPVAALVETPRELTALVSRGDGDTLERGLSGRDLQLLAQAEPGHVLLAAVVIKFLE